MSLLKLESFCIKILEFVKQKINSGFGVLIRKIDSQISTNPRNAEI